MKLFCYYALLALIFQAKAQKINDQLFNNGTWSLQAVLTQQQPDSFEGHSLALSADGTTMAVGAPRYNKDTGTVQLYVRAGSKWSLQATLSQQVADSQEGWSVALSGDGNTLATGAFAWGVDTPLDMQTGEVQIYMRSGNNWSHQATLTQNITGSGEGFSVALSVDGNTLAAGAPWVYSYPTVTETGAIHIYVRLGNQWVHQAMVSSDVLKAQEGISVALSADGNTLAAGAPYANQESSRSTEGAAHIYVRSGDTWSLQAKLSQYIDAAAEGASVSLSADGNTLASGSPGGWTPAPSPTPSGATQVYVRSGTNWLHQATLSQQLDGADEGNAVALSADGNMLLVSANFPYGFTGYPATGVTQIYSRSGTNWLHQETLSEGAAYSDQCVTLSKDNSTIAVGVVAEDFLNFNGTQGTYIYN